MWNKIRFARRNIAKYAIIETFYEGFYGGTIIK